MSAWINRAPGFLWVWFVLIVDKGKKWCTRSYFQVLTFNFQLSFSFAFVWNLFGRTFIWPYIKLILICWLVIPNFSILMGYLFFLLNFLMWYLGILTLWLVYGFFGSSAYVYEQFVRPFFVKHRLVGVWHVPEKGFFSSKLEDILAAWKYISEGKWKED